jgi:hypothetical protein
MLLAEWRHILLNLKRGISELQGKSDLQLGDIDFIEPRLESGKEIDVVIGSGRMKLKAERKRRKRP